MRLQLLVLLAFAVVSHLLIHAFSMQLATAGRKAVRLVTSPRGVNQRAAAEAPPADHVPSAPLDAVISAMAPGTSKPAKVAASGSWRAHGRGRPLSLRGVQLDVL